MVNEKLSLRTYFENKMADWEKARAKKQKATAGRFVGMGVCSDLRPFMGESQVNFMVKRKRVSPEKFIDRPI